MSDIQPGDFVDVRMVAVDVAGDRVVVRLPQQSAVHQFTIGRHQVQHTAPRSPEAIAADAVCASYDGVAPLADRAVRYDRGDLVIRKSQGVGTSMDFLFKR